MSSKSAPAILTYLSDLEGAVANLKDEHDDTIVFNAADEAEVFNAIAPKTGQVAAKWLAEPAGIFAAGNAIA